MATFLIGAAPSFSLSSSQTGLFSRSLLRQERALARQHRRRGRRGVEERETKMRARELREDALFSFFDRSPSSFFFCERGRARLGDRKKNNTTREEQLESLRSSLSLSLLSTFPRRWSPPRYGESCGRRQRARRGRARVGEWEKRKEKEIKCRTPSKREKRGGHRSRLFPLSLLCFANALLSSFRFLQHACLPSSEPFF